MQLRDAIVNQGRLPGAACGSECSIGGCHCHHCDAAVALKRLIADIEAGQVDVVVVYKADRLTRALSNLPSSSRCLTAAGGEQRRSSYFNNHRVEGDPAIVSGMKSGDTS
jgi:Resolvase, N terminal domain